MIFNEAREGMGSGFPFDGDYFPHIAEDTESVVVAQTVLEQKGRPFTLISQQDAPFRTEYWDGHEARVQLKVNGERREGYGSSTDNDVVGAFGQAYWQALRDHFPQLRDACFPNVSVVKQNGYPYTRLEFSAGSQRWVSRNGGVVVNSQEMGKLVAEGLMAGVHLTRL